MLLSLTNNDIAYAKIPSDKTTTKFIFVNKGSHAG